MMGYGYQGMMAGNSALGILTWMVVFADLVLIGVFLWKKIQKQ